MSEQEIGQDGQGDELARPIKQRVGMLTERARSAVAWSQSKSFGLLGRFTKPARSALDLAQEEARRLNHNYIGTEHLLLGLLREGEGIAANVLADLGVTLGEARAAVERVVGRGDGTASGDMRVTPRLKHAVELAGEEARALKQRSIGPEHLLLGLLREGEGMADRVLTSLDVSLDRARADVLAALAGVEQAVEYGAARTRGNVVMCRIDDRALAALDTLIEAGVCATRSEAAAWLIRAGVEANQPLLSTVSGKVGEIRRLREEARALARQAAAQPNPTPPVDATVPEAPA